MASEISAVASDIWTHCKSANLASQNASVTHNLNWVLNWLCRQIQCQIPVQIPSNSYVSSYVLMNEKDFRKLLQLPRVKSPCICYWHRFESFWNLSILVLELVLVLVFSAENQDLGEMHEMLEELWYWDADPCCSHQHGLVGALVPAFDAARSLEWSLVAQGSAQGVAQGCERVEAGCLYYKEYYKVSYKVLLQ